MSYLRVLSPRTRNGSDIIIGADHRVEYKETQLPMSAKRHLEVQNSKLPDHLKKVIEIVYDEAGKPVQVEPVSKKIEDAPVVRARGGRKPQPTPID